MSDVRTVYTKARAETAKLLGYGDDIDGLTAEQSTRLDIACALRIALDDQAAKLLRRESTDVSKLLSASEALGRILPPTVLASPPPDRREDAREIMLQTYLGMRKRGELAGPEHSHDAALKRIAELEAEIAALKAAGAPAPDEPAPAPGGNVVKLSLRHDHPRPPSAPAASPPASAAPAAPPTTTDEERARALAIANAPVPQHIRDTRPPNEAWRNFVKIDWQG
jgi:hypothetical protein